MVNSGSISFITETGGSKDSRGNIVAPTKVSSSFIPCNIDVINSKYELYTEGQYKQASYSIIIDMGIYKGLSLGAFKQVNLKDVDGVDLGTFQPMNIETLKTVQKIKIIL